MFNSLKYKISGTIFILVAIMLSLLVWQSLTSVFQQNKQNIEIAKSTSLSLLQQTARTALFSEEYDTIQFRIEGIIDNPHILHIFLTDNRNIIVASDQFEQLGKPAPVVKDDASSYWEIQKINNITGALGTLHVQYSFADINRQNRIFLVKELIIAALGTFIIAGISLFMGHLLTRRLATLSHVADDIRQGNFHSRARLKGSDEIAKLGHTFDTMATHIEKEQERLAELNQQLELRVAERTRDYENANKELEAFCHAVSHDLRAPLRSIEGFSLALAEDYADSLDDAALEYIDRLRKNTRHMSELIDSLLRLSRINQQAIEPAYINLSAICTDIISNLRERDKSRNITVKIADNIHACADKQLIAIALENLLNNAWKYTQKVTATAIIEFGLETIDQQKVYFVKDNGAGFDMRYVDRLFTTFQRLHSETDFEGNGVGLSTVQRIIHRHGGNIWANSSINQGSCFYFTLNEEHCQPDARITAA